MNIFVTGGAGFIGSNFVRYWLKQHAEDKVIVFDKLTYAGNMQNLDLTEKQLQFIQGDICEQQLLKQAVLDAQSDIIMHFAAETHVDRSIYGPADFIMTNIIGTFNLLEILRDNPQIRLHHVSTDEVFGSLPLNQPETKFNEQTKYDPSSPYSASKAASDHLVNAYVRTYGIKATLSNCSNNFGPYCYPEKFIPLVITRALLDQQIPIYGDGQQIRDWIHVDDHVYGLDLILQKGRLGEAYFLGGNGEKSNLEVAKMILAQLHKQESLLVRVGDRLGHDQRYAIDFSKAEKELGFKPDRDFNTRLQETVAWYKQNRAWWEPLKIQADQIALKYLSNSVSI